MKRLFVVLIVIAVLLTGCFKQTPSNSDPVPAQVVITRGTAGIVPLNLGASDDELHLVAIEVRLDSIYSKSYTQVIEPSTKTIPFEVFIPIGNGYTINAAIVGVDEEGYTTGNLYELGTTKNISISQPDTFITVQVSKPTISIRGPEVLYSGGAIAQFELIAEPAEMIRPFSFMMGSQLYVSQEPWTILDEFNLMYNTEPPTAWKWGDGLPQFEQPTTLYYRARVCSFGAGGVSGQISCFYYPNLDEDLLTIMVYPYPGY